MEKGEKVKGLKVKKLKGYNVKRVQAGEMKERGGAGKVRIKKGNQILDPLSLLSWIPGFLIQFDCRNRSRHGCRYSRRERGGQKFAIETKQ